MSPRERFKSTRLVTPVHEGDRPVLTLMIPPVDSGFWPKALLLRHAIATLCESLGLEVLDGPMPSLRLEEVDRKKRAVIVFGVKEVSHKLT